MNNFNDYYTYMNNNSQPNVNPFNNMYNINFDNQTFQNTFMNPNNIEKLYNPNEGFTKGNMFSNLYEPYKNYKPISIVAKNERDSLLQQIQMYKFAMNDLVLYLDTHPKNTNFIKTYNDYLMKTKELVNKYEKMYGPLELYNMNMPTNDWIWNNSPWPWEVI